MKERSAQLLERIGKDNIYEKRAENDQLNASMSILVHISKKWSKKGQQFNRLHLLVCREFQAQYTNFEITLEFPHSNFYSKFFAEDM